MVITESAKRFGAASSFDLKVIPTIAFHSDNRIKLKVRAGSALRRNVPIEKEEQIRKKYTLSLEDRIAIKVATVVSENLRRVRQRAFIDDQPILGKSKKDFLVSQDILNSLDYDRQG